MMRQSPVGVIATQNYTENEAISDLDVTSFFRDIDVSDNLSYVSTTLPLGYQSHPSG